MSSPFQQKFMAKNPVKGFTMAELERSTRRAEKKMIENADILNKLNPEANGPNYESTDTQRWAGDDGHEDSVEETQVSNGSVAQMASPLNAYVSTAGHFQRLQDNIARAFTPTKASKTKAEKEAEFKGETEKVSKKLKETTDTGFKDYNAKAEFDSKSGSVFGEDENNHFDRFGQ